MRRQVTFIQSIYILQESSNVRETNICQLAENRPAFDTADSSQRLDHAYDVRTTLASTAFTSNDASDPCPVAPKFPIVTPETWCQLYG